jgi:signal transduction histidine kinase
MLRLTACLTFTLLTFLGLAVEHAHSLRWESVVASALLPPRAGYEPVTLPDDWSRNRPPAARDVIWYRTQLPTTTDGEALALLIPRVGMHASVFLGDVWIGGTERGATDIAGAHRRPWLFTIPDLPDARETRMLFIRVSGLSEVRSGLATVEIAPISQLRPRYEAQMFWQVELVRIINTAVSTLALLALLIWRARGTQEAALGWFALATIMWAIASHHSIGGRSFIAEPYWSSLATLALGIAGIATVRFTLAFVAISFKWQSQLTRLYIATGLTALGVGLVASIPQILNVWLLPMLLAPAFLGAVFAWRAGESKDAESVWLAAAGIVNAVAAGHDLLLQMGAFVFDRPHWLPYGSAMLALGVVIALVRRFTVGVAATENLNRELERRVADATAKLAVIHERQVIMEAEAARTAERTRITQDMHDGLGSQLITALNAADRGELAPKAMADVLRECIDDMRLLIDSMEPDNTDLLALLGNLRYRLTPRLAAAGIELRWQVREKLGPGDLTAAQRLDVLRIVQEALTNVVKHARATTVTLASDAEGSLFVIDNGRDSAAAPSVAGYGLKNMARRAVRCRAQLAINSVPEQGTSVVLRWDSAGGQEGLTLPE